MRSIIAKRIAERDAAVARLLAGVSDPAERAALRREAEEADHHVRSGLRRYDLRGEDALRRGDLSQPER